MKYCILKKLGSVDPKGLYSKLPMNKIKRIDITFGAVDTERRDEASLTFAVKYGDTASTSINLKNKYNTDQSILYDIPTNTTNKYTWPVEVDPNFNGSTKEAPFNLTNLHFILQNEDLSSFIQLGEDASLKLKSSIEAIKIVYK